MKRLVKFGLNFLIVFYLGVIYFAGVPESNTLNSRLKQKAMKISFLVGIWPSWSMFAPNPVRFDSKSYIEVSYKNGETKEYDVEKDVKGPLATFRKARWMKYSQDNLRNPGQRALIMPALRYFKRKYDTPENPVVHIMLKRKWFEIPAFSDHKIYSIYSTPRNERFEVLMTQRFKR